MQKAASMPAVETPSAPTQPNESQSAEPPVAWEEFLEDEGDCCGGCNHKPR